MGGEEKLSAAVFAKASCVVSIGTLLTCYSIAVYLGHVPAWFPEISDLAVQSPERYIFRIGLIVSACLLFITASLVYLYIASATGAKKRADTVALALAAISSLGLAGVGAINEVEARTAHLTSAGIFFFGYLIFMLLTTYRVYYIPASRNGLGYKLVLTAISPPLFFTFVYFSLNYSTDYIQAAICEWAGVILIMIYNLSFLSEFQNEYIMELVISPSFKHGYTSGHNNGEGTATTANAMYFPLPQYAQKLNYIHVHNYNNL